MAQLYHNPFGGTNLYYPTEQEEIYQLYVQSSGKKIIDMSPFPRMVDLWFAGFSLAVHKKLARVDLSDKKPVKLHDGTVFDNDQDRWRVQALMLVAIGIEGNVDIVSEPRRIIDIANSFAAAGVPHIRDMICDGPSSDGIWNLSESLCNLLSEANG